VLKNFWVEENDMSSSMEVVER